MYVVTPKTFKEEAQGEIKGEISGKFTVIWDKQPEGKRQIARTALIHQKGAGKVTLNGQNTHPLAKRLEVRIQSWNWKETGKNIEKLRMKTNMIEKNG